MIRKLRAWIGEPVVTPLMTRVFVVTVFGAALAAPLAAAAVPYIDFFNDLAVQLKVKPQMAWQKVEATGEVIPGDRRSVAGTVPREHLPYPFPSKDLKVAEQAGIELRAGNDLVAPAYRPPTPTRTLLDRGQNRFETYCAVCHGKYGLGDGEVVKRGFPAPPSLLSDQVRGYPLGRIFHIATMGQNVMPSYARQLSPEDRWAVAYYLQALHKAFPPANEGKPDGP